jgi:hypothetical protein
MPHERFADFLDGTEIGTDRGSNHVLEKLNVLQSKRARKFDRADCARSSNSRRDGQLFNHANAGPPPPTNLRRLDRELKPGPTREQRL